MTKQQTINLIRKIRKEVPGIFIRTTLMTGHPGETEEDFRELCDFVSEMRFERLGVFPYSHEDDTYCDLHYEDDVPEDVKRGRAETVMRIQAGISGQIAASQVGKQLRVLIDREENGYYIGRSEHDSPEVDPEVLVESGNELEIGEFYEVEITASDDYDLYAKTIGNE